MAVPAMLGHGRDARGTKLWGPAALARGRTRAVAIAALARRRLFGPTARAKCLPRKQEYTVSQCGGIWLGAEFLSGPFLLPGSKQVEIPILRAAEQCKLRLPLRYPLQLRLPYPTLAQK